MTIGLYRLKILALDGLPIPEFPRQKLIDLSNTMRSEFCLYALMGYEIEAVFFKPEDDSFINSNDQAPIYDHFWSAATPDVRKSLSVIEDLV
ncbi:Protein fluG [Penicillium soppii]|uniref:Protein fluG n=1 Tax=Penicillium soppii TaxID=69789 RepID=UPI0025497C6E|nr:Protein fluG [Penicillium soppii]KAJ5882570.1 Protein fluG [Penicillium soppii]